MFYSAYIEEKLKLRPRIQSNIVESQKKPGSSSAPPIALSAAPISTEKTVTAQDKYEKEIDLWVDAIPGIKRVDASDLKDAGYSADEARMWIDEFKWHGGGNDYMRYILECDPEDAARESRCEFNTDPRREHAYKEMFI